LEIRIQVLESHRKHIQDSHVNFSIYKQDSKKHNHNYRSKPST